MIVKVHEVHPILFESLGNNSEPHALVPRSPPSPPRSRPAIDSASRLDVGPQQGRPFRQRKAQLGGGAPPVAPGLQRDGQRHLASRRVARGWGGARGGPALGPSKKLAQGSPRKGENRGSPSHSWNHDLQVVWKYFDWITLQLGQTLVCV